MQVVYHLGAPCTDGDLLLQSLLKNKAALERDGTVVPTPGRYRSVVRDTSRALKGRAATQEIQDALLDAIVDDMNVERLVLSDPRFICINRLVVQGAQIWPMIDRQTSQLRALFPQAEVEFFVGMRDPATLIPALFKSSRFNDFEEFIENMQPHAVAWSEMLRRLKIEHPDCPIFVWCNEDTPLIWGEILRELAGVASDFPLKGADDLVETIMEPAGFARLNGYLRTNPPQSEMQRRRIVTAFLERYVREDTLDEVLDLPGWSDALVHQLSEAYEEDIGVVARIPGVTLIEP